MSTQHTFDRPILSVAVIGAGPSGVSFAACSRQAAIKVADFPSHSARCRRLAILWTPALPSVFSKDSPHLVEYGLGVPISHSRHHIPVLLPALVTSHRSFLTIPMETTFSTMRMVIGKLLSLLQTPCIAICTIMFPLRRCRCGIRVSIGVIKTDSSSSFSSKTFHIPKIQ